MKSAQLHKLPLSSDSSYVYQQWECACFDKPWHFHQEFELVLINKGTGTRFIGDNVSRFRDYDLTLIGSNIPHLFRNDEKYYLPLRQSTVSSIFVHFTRDFLGRGFFNGPEMSKVERLLHKSSLALEIYGETKGYIIYQLNKMASESPPYRLLSLLKILIKLSESGEVNPLLSNGYSANNSGDTEKINNAFDYILQNYTGKIYEQEIAASLNMSTAAFSRYFKRHTRKTFSEYVTEIRIGNSCRLLMEDNYNISEICYLSGFENLSNFYRHFKKIVGIIPKEYRKRFLNAVTPASKDPVLKIV